MNACMPQRRGRAAMAAAAAAGMLAALTAAGCSQQPAASRASVDSCIRFGVQAIRGHVIVTTLPPACQGLTRAQVNFAVGTALRSVAVGAGGKARQRERIAAASRYLERLVRTVPEQRAPQAPAPATHQPSRATLALIAACTWLIAASVGLWMMAGWAARGRRVPAGRPQRPPALNLAHLGLALTGLLIWVAYLATRVTGVAWAACVLLPPVAGLGMTLVFLPVSSRPADGSPNGYAGPGGTAAVPARGNPARRRPRVLLVGVHIAFATATILFAFLAAIGTG